MHNNVRQIDDRASTKIRRVENEMLVIMQEHQEREQQEVSHNSFCSSFSRIRLEELNDMGYGFSRISPITFNDDAFQMPNNRAKDRAPTLTPRRKRNEANDISTTKAPQKDGNTKSHNTNILISNAGSNKSVSKFVPLQPNNTGSPSQETDSLNTKTVYYKKLNGGHQDKCIGIQHQPRIPYPQELTPLCKQQIKRLYRLREPKPHNLHPLGSLHQTGRHKHLPQGVLT